MSCARANILGDCVKVHVGDIALLTELPDNRGDGGVMAVGDAREEVVLNLVVEAAIEEAEQRAPNIGGADHLEEKT